MSYAICFGTATIAKHSATLSHAIGMADVAHKARVSATTIGQENRVKNVRLENMDRLVK